MSASDAHHRSSTNGAQASSIDPTPIRLGLLNEGYQPTPVCPPGCNHVDRHGKLCKSGGKAVHISGWAKGAATARDVCSWQRTRPQDTNTGILTGEMVGIDADILDPLLAAQVDDLAEQHFGPTPLRRIGRAPKWLRCYRAETPMPKLETPERRLNGETIQIEVMGKGQQVAAYGIHPGTMQPYTWIDREPLDVPLTELPLVSEVQLRAFLAAVDALFVEAGAELVVPPKAAAGGPYVNGHAAAGSAGGGDFFWNVNQAALANIRPWFTAIFPNAAQEAGSGAWRVSSADLGRSLEEDLSMHPTSGGQDFGTRESLSPISAVIRWGGAPDAKAAARWLCEQLGKNPADLGWKESKANGRASEHGNGKDHSRSTFDKTYSTNGPYTNGHGAQHEAEEQNEAIQVWPGQLHTLATAGEAALIKAGLPIYQRGHSLVQPVTVEVSASDGRITLASGLGELSLPVMLDKLSQAATWERWDARRKLPVACDPPRTVAEIILSRAGNWKVPRVAGVITAPTLRPDGTVLQAAGYDPTTRLYHVADPAIGRLVMPQRPTRADAELAMKRLIDLLDEFPFCTNVDRSVGLSALVTPVVRGAMTVSPMHGFSAPTPGSGKSFLADVAAAIATGRDCCPAITFADKADEGEKRLTGMLLAGFPLLSLDNVNGELGGDLLCQAIERRLIRLRALGGSTITEIENRACIFANGNNVTVRADVVRRTLVAKLDAKMERPEERTFDGNPVEKVLADRGVYIAACLTIVRAYLVAGSPDKLPPLASFGDWSNLVRSALVWLGCADPCDSIKDARRDDPELSELFEFLSLWKANLGIDSRYTARAVVDTAEARLSDVNGNPAVAYRLPDLHDVLLRIAGERSAINTRRFGKWLERFNGRIVGELQLSRDSVRGHGGVSVWTVTAA